MILSIFVIIILGAAAYFHYTQGFFSATLSAICAILAAVIAVSYQEPIVEGLLKGKMADYANGAVTVALFCLAYIILRVIFDKLVPGNVRVPVMVDKVGAGAAGLVAGAMAAGILAFAAQQLPFGPTVAARYNVSDREVQMIVAGRGAAQDLKNYDQLKDGTLDPSKASGLMVPADSWVLGLVNHLSDGGSLAGERPLASIHPSWLDELFASRIGIQVGAKQTAMKDWVGVEGVYRLDNVQQVDGDVTALRPPASEWKVDPVRKVDPSKVLLVLRVTYKAEATDTDSKFRFSPGAIPLIANGKWILPIGTLETAGGAPKLYAQRPDDFLIASGVDGFDMVYEVDRTDVLDNPDPKATDAKIKPGVFVEIKKLARIDLTDKPVSGPPPASPKFSIMRKVGLEPTKAPAPGQHKSPGGAPQAEQGTAPVTILDVKPQATLFSGINVPNNTGGQVTLKSGSATMTEKKFAKLAINATESLVIMRQGDFVITDLYVPSGKKMLQLSAQAPAGDQPDPWEWADKLGSFTLVDDKGTKYQPNGGWAKVKQQTTDKMVAQYDAANPVTSVAREDGRPLDVWVAFNVPSGVHIVDVQYEGKSVKAVDIQVP